MINLRSIFTFTLLTFPLYIFSQTSKKNLNHDVYEVWKRNVKQIISNNGEIVSYEINPLKGDGNLVVQFPQTDLIKVFPRGQKAKFSPNSSYIVFKIAPQEDTVLKQKRAKKKKDELPKDSLGIYIYEKDSVIKYPRVKSFKIAEDNSEWLAILFEKDLKKKKEKTEKSDTLQVDTVSKKEIDKGEKLLIVNPISGVDLSFNKIKDYTISKKNSTIAFVQEFGDSVDSVSVYVFKPELNEPKLVYQNIGYADKITVNDNGEQIAFLYSKDTVKEKVFELLFLENLEGNPRKIADTLSQELPNNWTASVNRGMFFSEDGRRLFFGAAPKPIHEPKDSLIDEEKAKVDIWSWTDKRLQPQQLNQLAKDKKRTHLATYNIEKEKLVLIGDTTIEDITILRDGIADWALGYDRMKYANMISWEYPAYKNLYAINLLTGEKKFMLEKKQYRTYMSPNGDYIIWFEATDSSWYSISVENKEVISLTKSIPVNFYNEKSDIPAEPSSYGIAGWTSDEKSILIYDKYDIWRASLSEEKDKECITGGYGRKNNIELRYAKLNKDEDFVSLDEPILLESFHHKTKSEGYYSLNISKANSLKKLIEEDYLFTKPKKAKNGDQLIFRKSSFTEYPEVYYSDLSFKKIKKLSSTNPQQKEYFWPTVEQVSWNDFNGVELDGLLYKPENFDANKKYPLLIYFYEKSSDELHSYWIPSPSRSIINPSFYGSNDYIVFIPDIVYEKGFPGKGAYNAIVSGAMHLAEESWIDRDRIGIQGQSWGGYQVAFLITQTNMFRCGMAGAPVSNMTSAYGGIRWGSGLSRAFQYEETQSRIGGDLWESLPLYIENSPLFYADRVNTPLLMMHNDNDGAVPWYQGIEYFNALRRLNKPVWMLVYNNEEHNLNNWPNRVDLSIRMFQFFEHYLKDKPAPDWMLNGVPALEKGKKNMYDLLEE